MNQLVSEEYKSSGDRVSRFDDSGEQKDQSAKKLMSRLEDDSHLASPS